MMSLNDLISPQAVIASLKANGKKQALIELSAVTVPSNKNALVEAKADGAQLQELVSKLDTLLAVFTERAEGLKTIPDVSRKIDELLAQAKTGILSAADLAPKPKQELYPGVSSEAVSELLAIARQA